MKQKDDGLVYIFTGDGKGKTSAALGMMLRAYCVGMKVGWVGWYKQKEWNISEMQVPKFLKNVTFELLGKGFYFEKKDRGVIKVGSQTRIAKTKTGVVTDTHTHTEHRQAAQASFLKAKEILESHSYDLLICDELCQAVHQRLVSSAQIRELLAVREKTNVVCTGRDCPKSLIRLADTVTEMKNIKHAYDKGIAAVRGLDF